MSSKISEFSGAAGEGGDNENERAGEMTEQTKGLAANPGAQSLFFRTLGGRREATLQVVLWPPYVHRP